MENENRITYLGETDFRNKKTRFGIKAKDRAKHVYIIGKTGMGKSTLLENMAVQDIQNGEGMAFMDPHGGSAEKLLDYIPESRVKDVIYFAPFDTNNPISFNVMEDVGPDKRHLVSSGLMSAFKKIWVDAWSARMEYILNNILLALLEYPDATLLGVNRMLSDKDFRKKVVDNVTDPSVKSFWVDEFAKYGDRYMQEAGAAIQNKIGQFTSNPVIRNIIGQPKSSFDVRKVMDEKKILIMNLSKGLIGEQNSNLLGGMLITKIYLSAMSRADSSPKELSALPNFYFYVDEFQSFANESFADILSEARKYKLNLTIAHQYIEQMVEEVRNAVFGNVGTTITFRVGPFDAEVLEKIFFPVFDKEDIVNLGYTQVYMTLMIDGIGSKPFSATTLTPIKAPDISFKDEAIEWSQKQNTNNKEIVSKKIEDWMAESFAPARGEGGDYKNNKTGQNNSYNNKNPDNNFYKKPKTDNFNNNRPKPEFKEEKKEDNFNKERNNFNDNKERKNESFKKNFNDNQIPKKEEISLANLAPKNKNKDTKTASSGNMNGLREVLLSVISEKDEDDNKKKEVEKKEVVDINNKEPKESSIVMGDKQEEIKPKNNPTHNNQDSTVLNKKPREIPEDVLRKILD